MSVLPENAVVVNRSLSMLMPNEMLPAPRKTILVVFVMGASCRGGRIGRGDCAVQRIIAVSTRLVW